MNFSIDKRLKSSYLGACVKFGKITYHPSTKIQEMAQASQKFLNEQLTHCPHCLLFCMPVILYIKKKYFYLLSINIVEKAYTQEWFWLWRVCGPKAAKKCLGTTVLKSRTLELKTTTKSFFPLITRFFVSFNNKK